MDVRSILQSEAASLFLERTVDILPGYQPGEGDIATIAQICLRLDGIPLAIELAAARMNLLSAQEIAARLDSRFSLLTGGRRTALPRHQTLQAAIEWSYDLLGEVEQVLLRRLSIFAGSFTLEGAEAVCPGDGIRSDEVLTSVGRLVDKSLLQVENVRQDMDLPTRYRFLETIRSFGRLKLDEAVETRQMSDRHAAYYVRLVEAAEPELLMQNQVRWHKLLRAENENLRAVIEWSGVNDQAESALRLSGSSWWFWFRSGTYHEGRDLSLKALALPSAMKYTETRARALNTAGLMQCLLGDTTLAKQSLEEAISILRQSGDEASLAWALQFLGLVHTYNWEYELAEAALKDGLAINRKIGDAQANNFLFFLGDIELQKGDFSRAKKIYEESVDILGSFGNKSFLAYPLRRLGYVALEQNDLPNAWKYFHESLNLNREVGDITGIAACLGSLAALAISMDKPVLAARLFGAVQSRLESLAINLLYLDQVELGRISSQLTHMLDEATFTKAFNEGWELIEEGAVELVEEVFGAV